MDVDPRSVLRQAVLAAGLLLVLAVPVVTAGEDPGWPREYVRGEASIILHQPQIESWDDYVTLGARLAISIREKPDAQTIFGAVTLQVGTLVDFETRTVGLLEIESLEIRFPGQTDAAQAAVGEIVEDVVLNFDHRISLDRIIANLSGAPLSTPKGGISLAPPPIFYSDGPAILVIFDGEPIFAPIEGIDLDFAMNTNWDLFRTRDGSGYFLRHDDAWLETADLFDKWAPAGDLPPSLEKLPDDENWQDVKNNLPGRGLSYDEMPRVFVSQQPAELILTEGPVEIEPIGDGLLYATNSTSDLFQHIDSQQYYLLISGRWFRSPAPAGPWSAATDDLPDDFGSIPADHEMAHVLVSVPGTPEAEAAAIQAQIPQQADVKRDEATLEVAYNGEPEFVPIEETGMQRAVNTSQDVILVSGLYYCCHQGVWFVSTSAQGSWVVCDDVPTIIYEIPATCPAHHVTYVHVYHSTPTTVVYGYTGGYMGIYVYNGCVVYGGGYYWPPYYYYPPYGYPVYYPYPYYSYGCNAWYNPHTGTYARGGVAYGPYGGIGRGVAYNPHTGAYARGASAWGPSGGTWAAEAWNPRTGGYARTQQNVDPYKQWGSTVATRGSDWVRTGHVTGSDGTIAGFETSSGRRGIAARGEDGQGGFITRSGDDDLYVGRDGDVYKHDDGNWYRNDDGDWQEMDRDRGDTPRLSDEQRSQAEERAQDRSGQQLSDEQRGQAQQRAQDRTQGGSGQQLSDEQRRQAQDRQGQARGQDGRRQLEQDRRARQEGDRRSRQYQEQRKSGQRSQGNRQRGGGGRRR